jgi:hypothetical protein
LVATATASALLVDAARVPICLMSARSIRLVGALLILLGVTLLITSL